MLTNQKVQVQREFEAFKEMATQVGEEGSGRAVVRPWAGA